MCSLPANSLTLTWDAATDGLDELEVSAAPFSPLNVDQVRKFLLLRDSCHSAGMGCVPGEELKREYSLSDEVVEDAAMQLIELFPLLGVQCGKRLVLVDYTELVFRPNLVHELLTLDKGGHPGCSDTRGISSANVDGAVADTAATAAAGDDDEDVSSEADGIMFFQKPGPTPLQHRFPEILTAMTEFVKMHGFGAHQRRRTGTGTSNGVTVEQIRQHVLENVDGLEKISRSKIYNLLQPARSTSKEASRHVDAIDVRVGVKTCDISKENINAHEYFATVEAVRQMSAEYPSEVTLMSCDSKAKVHIGGQAVSRYHQLRTFFPVDDMPHYHDHDFPVPGYLIEPDGYLVLQAKAQPAVTKDKHGRDIVSTPATGPMFVYNRCVKNSSTNIADHVHDISDILHKNQSLKKPVLALITDGGPDWSPKSNANQFILGKLWKDGGFDMLISCCNAPGLSRYNPVEHLWSPCSKWLAGVSLSASLPGETTPPALQSVSPEVRTQKEKQVFNLALEQLNDYWDGRIHDGFRVTSVPVTIGDDIHSVPAPSGYEDVKDLMKSSLRSIRDDQEKQKLLDEWKFFVRHMDRRWGFICFRRGACGDQACECMKPAIRAKDVMSLPSGEQWLFPPITPDPDHPGHYMTFRQLKLSLAYSCPDQHMTGLLHELCGKCRYVFTSETDRQRHNKLMHGGAPRAVAADGDPEEPAAKKPAVKCPVCLVAYQTRYQLRKHQSEAGHTRPKGCPSRQSAE